MYVLFSGHFLLVPHLSVLDKDESHGQRPPAATRELGLVNFCSLPCPDLYMYCLVVTPGSSDL